MKLSEQTISILKNFSNINSGLFFQQGKQIRTVAPSKAILAHANIAEEIPVEFGIYDLNRLLGVLSLIEQPDIEFGDKQLVLKDATRSSRGQKQTYCDASLVVRPPNKEVALPTEDVKFTLQKTVYEYIVKSSAILQYPEVAVVGDGSKVKIVVINSKNQMTDEAFDEVGETDKNFKFIFKVENFSKIMSKEYNVSLSQKGLAKFVSTDDVLTYFIALEPNSVFEG